MKLFGYFAGIEMFVKFGVAYLYVSRFDDEPDWIALSERKLLVTH
jgi:hypothetical protein